MLALSQGVSLGVLSGVALIAGLVAWFTIRRRQCHTPSMGYICGQGSDMGVVPHLIGIERPKLYVSVFFRPAIGHD